MEPFTNIDTAPAAERKELILLSMALLWSGPSYLSSFLPLLPLAQPPSQCTVWSLTSCLRITCNTQSMQSILDLLNLG